MALPKIETPLIPIELPVSGKKLVLRQMLTKEYKTVMSAINSNSTGVMLKTLSEIINSCVVEPKDFDINQYTSYEVDYLFLRIYGISVNGTVEVAMRCNNMVKKLETYIDDLGFERKGENYVDAPCDTSFVIQIPLDEVVYDEPKKGVFEIGSGVVLKMKYPTWAVMHEIISEYDDDLEEAKTVGVGTKDDETTQEQTMKLIYNSIDEIWVNDEKYDEEFTYEEFLPWIDAFPMDKLTEIGNYIQNIPQISFTKELTCPSCGNKEIVSLVGLESFLK